MYTTNRDMVKFIQRGLNLHSRARLTEDGLYGRKTRLAINVIPLIPIRWEDERKIIGCIQYLCTTLGLDAGPIDGYWGPQTENAFEIATGKVSEYWRDDADASSPTTTEGTFTPSAQDWPQPNADAKTKYYGTVGTNQTKVQLPYKMVLAWNESKSLTSFTCHELVADNMARVFDRVLDHYGLEQIAELGLDKFAGCLNVRKVRGGRAWSSHSWGCALDIDSANNRLRWGKDRAKMAGPEYDMWFKLWAEEGGASLGKLKNFDFMHIEFVNHKKRYF